MKKCPNCKAEIEENARFCLYCMTSFEEKQPISAPNQEKNKRWLYVLAAVLAFVLMLCVVFVCIAAFRNSEPANSAGSDYLFSSHGALSSISASTQSTSSDSEQKSSEAASLSGNNNQVQGGSGTQISSNKSSSESKDSSTSTSSAGKTSVSSGNTTAGSSTSSSVSSKSTSSSISSDSGSSSSSKQSSSGSDTTLVSPAPPAETAEYLYRDAQYGDDYAVFTDLTNCVVITGIKTASADGRYTIPEKIDGKSVLAIMQGAFCDENFRDTVKEVIVPSTVKTIWNGAFTKCYNLTDIYFCGNSIYTDPYAFADVSKRNGTLTIHCSENCWNRNFNYYKDSASGYDAEYKEWNG